MKKLTICHISDIHSYFESLDMPQADVLCDTGDFTFRGRPEELKAYNEWLGKLKELGLYKHILVNAGNHELSLEGNKSYAITALSNATYLENESVTIDGFNFYGSPLTPEFYDWAFMYKQDEAESIWSMIPDDTDVLMTHGPPHGILDATQRGVSAGCPELYKRVFQIKPQAHLFGHIHEANGLHMFNGTTFSNNSINTVNYNPTNSARIIEVTK